MAGLICLKLNSDHVALLFNGCSFPLQWYPHLRCHSSSLPFQPLSPQDFRPLESQTKQRSLNMGQALSLPCCSQCFSLPPHLSHHVCWTPTICLRLRVQTHIWIDRVPKFLWPKCYLHGFPWTSFIPRSQHAPGSFPASAMGSYAWHWSSHRIWATLRP